LLLIIIGLFGSGMDVKMAEHNRALTKAAADVANEKKLFDDLQDEVNIAKAIRTESMDSWQKWQVARTKQINERWTDQKEGIEIRIKESSEVGIINSLVTYTIEYGSKSMSMMMNEWYE
jgi:hypothetical protein